MKVLYLATAALLIACCACGSKEKREPTPTKDLTAAEADKYFSGTLLKEWKDSIVRSTATFVSNQAIYKSGKTMKIWWKTYGNKPSDGRSLWISLHGGGGTAPETNDGQWNNQKSLYSPSEGVYLCPRAIQDTWDLHFVPETDAFYKEIIRMAVAHWDVNPDKVYLMGYSAGGDGVWRLAPRLANHWAAASMMAGHPGDVSLVNLRNTPFMIWCGAQDNAYNRNVECANRIAEMEALQEADPDGYIHEGHIVEGKGHWMDGVDRAAVPWMAKYKRNPYPDKIVWKQEEVLQSYFYWLGAPKGETARGKEVLASVKDNVIRIEKCDYTRLTLFLDDALVNLDQSVKVLAGEKVLFEGKLARKAGNMRKSLQLRNDISYACPAILEVKL